MRNRKIRTLSLLAALLLLLLSGCGNHTGSSGEEIDDSWAENSDEPVRFLTMVTEEGMSHRFKNQIKDVIQQFEMEHMSVTVQLEELPSEDVARTQKLTEIRTAISEGEGPDLYLLPTKVIAGSNWHAEHLFREVNQAMRSGCFADLSRYYEEDRDLGTEQLNHTVMEAGVVDGVRYTLPLRYNYLVNFVNETQLQARGLDFWTLNEGIISMMEAAAQQQDPQLAANVLYSLGGYHALILFSEFVDYDEQRVLLSREKLVDFLESYQTLREIQGVTIGGNSGMNAYCHDKHWLDEGQGMLGRELTFVLQEAAVSRLSGQQIDMVPLTGVDGKLVAEVTMYGAVGAGCPDPKLAYELLRMFLLPEVQWEENASGSNLAGNAVIEGYPVRYVDSVPTLYSNTYARHIPLESRNQDGEIITNRERRYAAMELRTLSDEDVPILHIPIDSASYFSFDLQASFESLLMGLNDRYTGAPIEDNVEAAADAWLEEVERYLQTQ